MRISVVIPAHGRPDLLIDCLRSLCDTGYDDAEICVVDDGSALDEQAVRSAVEATLPLTWRSFPLTRGRSAARNEGVRATTGDIIIFLDADMETEPGFLAAHITHHLDNPHTVGLGRIIWPKRSSFARYLGGRGIAKLAPGDTVPPWYFVTGNASVAREDLPSEGPFDETLSGWGGEDLDLGLRLSVRGVRFSIVPTALSHHRFTGNPVEYAERLRSYGAEVLPVLVKRHPSVARITRVDLLDSPLWRLVISPILHRPLLRMAAALDLLPLPSILYDYLIFGAYGRGWLERTK